MPSPETEHGMEVANEQEANQRYLTILERKVATHIPIAVARSSLWTGTGLPVPTEPVVGPIVARIALSEPSALIGGSTFYIGPWHVAEDGIVAFSWAAPIAALLYETSEQDDDYGEVVARRTMTVNAQTRHIDDFDDEWVVEPISPSPFTTTRTLSIPAPPQATKGPVDDRPRPPLPPQDTATRPESQGPVASSTPNTPVAPRGSEAKPPASKKTQQRPLRAAEAVKSALAAPRGASLPTLLGTLQPDQYDFVTRPLQPPLVIQGHPGTGKTVIAAHRAAWLVHPERGESSSGLRVLIVGPNDHYADHVKGVLDALVAQRSRVVALGLSRLMLKLRRLEYKVGGSLDGSHYDVDNELGFIIDAAAFELREAGELRRANKTETAAQMVYEALRANTAANTPLTEDQDLINYLRKLPRWKVALTQRRYLPLTTYCSLSAVPYNAQGFDHIVVDEAQDVRPLEWRIIQSLSRAKSWTILGDMNQRRSDWSYHSWDHLAVDLGIADDQEHAPLDTFVRGYRSTGPIIKYANRLLPARERGADLIQEEGPPPRIYRVKELDVPNAAVAVATHLYETYAPGTVAVIATNREDLGRSMVGDGWRQDPVDKRLMVKGRTRIHLVTPENARGLEFDGVVVVEPAEFPENLARLGTLYTSLTRANRELAVVHFKALPDGLRNQGLTSRVADLTPL